MKNPLPIGWEEGKTNTTFNTLTATTPEAQLPKTKEKAV